MSLAQESKISRVLAVVNAHSGNADSTRVVETLRARLAERAEECILEIHETLKDEDLATTIRRAVTRDGFDLIVAAGGDGTVSEVANGLVGTESVLAIIPLGTTNVLARELGVPLDLDGACNLLSGANSTARVDAMKVDSSYYFTQIGVGIDALMINDTTEVDKRRMGPLAYVRTWLKNLISSKPRRITVTADGLSVQTRTLQVLLANCGTLGVSGLRWGQDVRVDDGRVDVCIFQPRTPLEYPRIAWNFLCGSHRSEPRLTYLHASKSVTVQADEPLPVQGDGEILSQTPLTVEVVPNAIRVLAPARSAADPVASPTP